MKIGVGVEGPSDAKFWGKVLCKHFQSHQFYVRNMNCKSKLIRETPKLVDHYRKLGYAAAIIFVDCDDPPYCATPVIEKFEAETQEMAREPLQERFVFICVAIRELEAWFLADPAAIKKIVEVAYQPSTQEDTGDLNAEKTLKDLWRKQHGKNSPLNKIDFAERIAKHFNPEQAMKRSASFKHCWNRIRDKVNDFSET